MTEPIITPPMATAIMPAITQVSGPRDGPMNISIITPVISAIGSTIIACRAPLCCGSLSSGGSWRVNSPVGISGPPRRAGRRNSTVPMLVSLHPGRRPPSTTEHGPVRVDPGFRPGRRRVPAGKKIPVSR
ncbi:hypothetical protein [Micromonospora humida]|uniref:hypothetical protein n=1 Tax=Micromonospora humida TaxID=2809018 RepID=UPI003F4DE721